MTSTIPSIADRLAETHPSMGFAKARLWQTFMDRTIELLRWVEVELRKDQRMAAARAKDGWWLDATRKGGDGSDVRVPSEDAITDEIEEVASERLLDTRPSDPTKDHLRIVAQAKRPKHDRTGRKAKKTDLQVTSTLAPDLDVRLEAKLLWQKTDLTVAYSGKQGLMRYADPLRPYTHSPLGFMLGYALRDLDPGWRELTRTTLSTLAGVEGFGDVAAAGEVHPVSDLRWGELEHQRVSVLHLVMSFDTDPPSR